jgi:hypothetical protein
MEQIMGDIQQIMLVTNVKRRFRDILKVVQEEDSTITLIRNGEAMGIIMTPDTAKEFDKWFDQGEDIPTKVGSYQKSDKA